MTNPCGCFLTYSTLPHSMSSMPLNKEMLPVVPEALKPHSLPVVVVRAKKRYVTILLHNLLKCLLQVECCTRTSNANLQFKYTNSCDNYDVRKCTNDQIMQLC